MKSLRPRSPAEVRGGVGTTIGGDCAGAKELPPEMPLEWERRGMLFAAGGVEVAAPEADTGGVLCPPLDHGADDEPGWAIVLGVGAEMFSIDSAGEDGVVPGD